MNQGALASQYDQEWTTGASECSHCPREAWENMKKNGFWLLCVTLKFKNKIKKTNSGLFNP